MGSACCKALRWFRPAFFAGCLLGPLGAAAAPFYPDLPGVAGVEAPSPRPAAPGDVFTPPLSPGLAALPCTPAIAEWTRSAGPGQSLALTGADFSNYVDSYTGQDSSFVVYAQNSAGNGVMGRASLQRLGTGRDRALLTLPAALPSSTYLLWPENAAGLGAPVLLNKTDFWWLGPSTAGPGESSSAFGRNFFFNGVTPSVFVGTPGVGFSAVPVTAWNPYKIDFQVPAGLAAGSYEVWVHNGHGGDWGWSGPQTLLVEAPMAWTGPSVSVTDPAYAGGADPSGAADSYPAIQAALTAAAGLARVNGNATVRFPAGTFQVLRHLVPPSRVRWLGAGLGATTITAKAGFLDTCLLGPNNPHSSDHIEMSGLGFAAGPNGANYLPTTGPNSHILVWLRQLTDLRFNQVAFEAIGSMAFDFSNDSFVRFKRCVFTGGNNQSTALYSLMAKQVFIDECDFQGTADAGGLMGLHGVKGLSVTRSTGRDLDNSDPANNRGWGQGRFLYGNSAVNSERYVYAGDNATYQLAVRPGTIGSTGRPDLNTGEQYLWEGQFTLAHGRPSAAGPYTLTLPGLNTAITGREAAGYWAAVVVGGRGLGQHRLVSAYLGGDTVAVDPPWRVAPDAGSEVILAQVLDKCVVYNNFIQGKAGYAALASSSLAIEPYGGSFDFIADGNTIEQVRRGINSFGRGEMDRALGSIEPTYFNLYQNNRVTRTLVGLSSILSDWDPAWTQDPGVMYLGNSFRGNSVSQAAVAGYEMSLGSVRAIAGRQMDMNIFEDNDLSDCVTGISCVGSSTAVPLGPQLGSTLFRANRLDACPGCAAAPAGSKGIVFGSGQQPVLQDNRWTRFQTVYAGVPPGPVLEAPYRSDRAGSFPASGMVVLANAGSSPLVCTATAGAAWLSTLPLSAAIPAESRYTFVYSAAAVTETGAVWATINAQAGAASQTLMVYTNDGAAGIGYCQPATPVPTAKAAAQAAAGSYLFPSPARGGSAQVAYTMQGPGRVKILVFNEAGRLVDKVEDEKPAGAQTSLLSCGLWAPGVYFYLCTLSPEGGAEAPLPMVKFSVVH
jgi:hypothetical protein